VGLVTASALLDLMPDHWIEGLVARLAQARLPFYAALNYDGHMAWSPALPHDDVVTAAFNRHQQSDKGLGPAAGPTATEVTQAAFEKAGYQVSTADSPWSLGPKDSALQRELLRGIANAAQEVGETTADGWHAARLAKLPEAHATIGHTDLLAWPA
ncbi:MAG: class I SAM-dependent methyltransferase, partial [Pseudomonadota bacterium]